MKELDRSGELLALCYREQWPKATQLLTDAILTVKKLLLPSCYPVDVTVTSRTNALRPAQLLRHFIKRLLTLESLIESLPYSCVGGTAVCAGNCTSRPPKSKYIGAKGADVAIPDKKGVRPMDLMTWTAVIHPTVMVPPTSENCSFERMKPKKTPLQHVPFEQKWINRYAELK
ncbi:hypothetical protein JG688_00011983 [Phytophthora aleatoria]|uniref:Uncharacterized protein n=1 Tax=Phytophthora aleatoria TaxID=2496075 RepID=A0A8J5IRR8_9STRA|nr:hypothetical protein JG688_00011983 [Phytophthora aleatoria]